MLYRACQWPGCTRKVPAAYWGCNEHYYALPVYLRAKLRDSYRFLFEGGTPHSADYVAALAETQRWIAGQIERQKRQLPLI